LSKLKLENNLITFSIPGILPRLISQLKIPNPDNLISALKSKDIIGIKKYAENYSELLLEISLNNFDDNLINNEILQSERENIEKILNVKKQILEKYPNSKIDIDLFDDNFSFQENFGFMIFIDNFQYPVSRGGSYNIGNKNAIGGTLYVNHLLKLYNSP